MKPAADSQSYQHADEMNKKRCDCQVACVIIGEEELVNKDKAGKKTEGCEKMK